MRSVTLIALVVVALRSASASPPEHASPFAGPSPWPEIRKERIRTLLPAAMRRAGVDAWLVVCRENDNDPLAAHVGGENAGAPAAFFFTLTPTGVKSLALSPASEATALKDMRLVGYWAHDVGPALSGAQRETPPVGASLRLLQPGQTFAFDGFFSWVLPGTAGGEKATKTISVEEMAVVTERGAEYLIPPQEDLVLIPSAGR